MGFSPGDFCDKNARYHWELKDGPRVVLWDDLETKKILELDKINTNIVVRQLHTLVAMMDGEA